MLEGTTILQSMDVRTSLRPNLYRPNEAIKPSIWQLKHLWSPTATTIVRGLPTTTNRETTLFGPVLLTGISSSQCPTTTDPTQLFIIYYLVGLILFLYFFHVNLS